MKQSPGALFALRLLLAVAGTAMLGLSIAVLYWTGLGSDPTSVLVDGLHRRLGISHGMGSNLVNLSMLLALLLVGRKKIGLSTVLSALLIGPFIDLFQLVIPAEASGGPPLWQGVPLCLAAVILNGAGLGLYLSAGLGASAFDGVILTLHERFHISPQTAMYGFYAVVFLLGVLLGGVWGIGTLCSLVLCGRVFQYFRELFRRRVSEPLGICAT